MERCGLRFLSIGIKRRVSIFSESQYTNISYRHVWNTFQLILLLRCEREGGRGHQNIKISIWRIDISQTRRWVRLDYVWVWMNTNTWKFLIEEFWSNFLSHHPSRNRSRWLYLRVGSANNANKILSISTTNTKVQLTKFGHFLSKILNTLSPCNQTNKY